MLQFKKAWPLWMNGGLLGCMNNCHSLKFFCAQHSSFFVRFVGGVTVFERLGETETRIEGNGWRRDAKFLDNTVGNEYPRIRNCARRPTTRKAESKIGAYVAQPVHFLLLQIQLSRWEHKGAGKRKGRRKLELQNKGREQQVDLHFQSYGTSHASVIGHQFSHGSSRHAKEKMRKKIFSTSIHWQEELAHVLQKIERCLKNSRGGGEIWPKSKRSLIEPKVETKIGGGGPMRGQWYLYTRIYLIQESKEEKTSQKWKEEYKKYFKIAMMKVCSSFNWSISSICDKRQCVIDFFIKFLPAVVQRVGWYKSFGNG